MKGIEGRNVGDVADAATFAITDISRVEDLAALGTLQTALMPSFIERKNLLVKVD